MRLLRNLLFSFVALGATAANAAVVSLDFRTPGDGLITRDTRNNLEWLDLTQTQGLSPIEAVASFEADGFKWANDRQLNGLLATFRLPEVAGFAASLTVVPTRRAFRYQRFLGITDPFDPSGPRGPSTNGVYDDRLLDNTTRILILDLTEAPPGGVPSSTLFNTGFGAPACDDCVADPRQGVYLVRVVPLPAPVLFLLSGCAAFFAVRRRRPIPSAA